MNSAESYRVAGVPGLYLMQTTTSNGDVAVFAYLRLDDRLFAGAGGSVIEAVSDVFQLATKQTVPAGVLLALPTLDQVADLTVERQ